MSYTIAEIRIDDIDTSVTACLCAIWAPTANKDELIEIIRAKLRLHSDCVLLAAKNSEGKIVGYRFAHSIPKDGQVEGFRFTMAIMPDGFDFVLYDSDGGVHPDYRRRGIGRALLREQHRRAKEKGYRKIVTAVALNLRPMMILNLQEGFDIVDLIAVKTDSWHTRALIFEKSL